MLFFNNGSFKMSKKQSAIYRKLRRIKRDLADNSIYCRICGDYAVDLAHLLPRSLYPEHQTKFWNLTLLCRNCHVKFDEDKRFRRLSGLGEHIKKFDEQAYNRYYLD